MGMQVSYRGIAKVPQEGAVWENSPASRGDHSGMPTEKPILTFAVDEEHKGRINNFKFDNRIETRSEAIRMLDESGLKKFEIAKRKKGKTSA